MPWKLTVRAGARVEHVRYAGLDEALAELERRVEKLAAEARERPLSTRLSRYDAADQVAARIELAGPQRLLPSSRGGLDVRGDGSTHAYTGGVRRRLLEPGRGESAARALRRELER